MSTQIMEPILDNGREDLKLSNELSAILEMMSDILSEKSALKKNVDHSPATMMGGVNTILGAMITTGSLETMKQIYGVIRDVLLPLIQTQAKKQGMLPDSLDILAMICSQITELNPFAHRTTVQEILNHHEQDK